MNDQERSFLNAAMQLGFLGTEEARECVTVQKQMQTLGLTKLVWEVAFEKKFLTQHQVEKVSMALRQSRSTAFFPGYRILKKLGQGGMGTVYQAIQTSLDRKVAIKVLSPEHFKDQDYLQRIAREAKTLAKLNHPNIVSAIDFGVHGGVYYLVMEYVDGVSLDDEVKKGVIFKEKEALGIALQIASALDHANQNNLIHRDIKPANIMIDQKGIAKLCDLGLAKETQMEGKDVTQAGQAMGTPVYMSPEQARGEKTIDIRTDIYSLGAALYHLVTGQPPFKAPGVGGIFAQILSKDVPNPRKDNPNLSFPTMRLIRKMMAKDPKDRPQDPTELVQEIKGAQRGGSFSTVSRIQLSEIEAVHLQEKHKKILLIGVSIFSCLVLLLVGVLLFGKKEKGETKIPKKLAIKPPKTKGDGKGPGSGSARSTGSGLGTGTGTGTGAGTGAGTGTGTGTQQITPRDPSDGGGAFSKKLYQMLFAKGYRKSLKDGRVILVYQFDQDPDFLSFYWDRTESTWKEKGDLLVEKEILRFMTPVEKIDMISFFPKTEGDFFVGLYFADGTRRGIVWRAGQKKLQLKEGDVLIKETVLSKSFSEEKPLLVGQLDGSLKVGHQEEFALSEKSSSPLKYFVLVPLMELRFKGIILGVRMDKVNMLRAIQWLKGSKLLPQAKYTHLTLNGQSEMLLSPSAKQNVLKITLDKKKFLAYQIDFEFSFPKGEFFSFYFPFGKQMLRWVFKRTKRTGVFPISRLEPKDLFYFQSGNPKLTWHRASLQVLDNNFARADVDGKRDFTLDYRFPMSRKSFNSNSPHFFSNGSLSIRNVKVRGIPKED